MCDVCSTLVCGLRVWRMYEARLAQSVERKTLNLVVVGSSPTVGDRFVVCRFVLVTSCFLTYSFLAYSFLTYSFLTYIFLVVG